MHAHNLWGDLQNEKKKKWMKGTLGKETSRPYFVPTNTQL